MRLIDVIRRWLGGAAPPPPPPPAPPAPPAPAGDLQARFLAAVSAVRAKHGLGPFAADARLAAAAQELCGEMARRNAVGHFGFPDRLYAAGYPRAAPVGEVAAGGQRSPEEAVADWTASPGHLAQMTDPRFRLAGFGNSGPFWAGSFGG